MDVHFNVNSKISFLNPDTEDFEIVERKFRGHPDSLADMVAQRFSQLYIKETWKKFPCLENNKFPNFSADKITLSGASSIYENKEKKIIKPVNALLIGKITSFIGEVKINIEDIFRTSINDVFMRSLVDNSWKNYINITTYSALKAGSDHHENFYHPKSEQQLLEILSKETLANDTVFVVAYSPLSIVEKLTIYLDNLTDSREYRALFNQTGTDIKTIIRRYKSNFDITMCIPVLPDRISNVNEYDIILKHLHEYLYEKISNQLVYYGCKFDKINLAINTKDTKELKYFAIWGTALSKGDIGAVGRGNRQQGFISGLRPSTNEAFSGKNPNHFAGVVFQLIAENISQQIYKILHIRNVVYIVANNGDYLYAPHSIYVTLESGDVKIQNSVREIIGYSLDNIDMLRKDYIQCDVYEKFMNIEEVP